MRINHVELKDKILSLETRLAEEKKKVKKEKDVSDL